MTLEITTKDLEKILEKWAKETFNIAEVDVSIANTSVSEEFLREHLLIDVKSEFILGDPSKTSTESITRKKE